MRREFDLYIGHRYWCPCHRRFGEDDGLVGFYEVNKVPWDNYRTSICTVQISKAVTSIGNYAFGSCSNLAGITILNPDCQIDDNQFGEWKVRTPAKCEKTGVDYHICLVCQHEETRTTEKLGHDYATAWTVDTPANCTTPGSKSHHCTRCDAITDMTEIPATGAHTYVDGICKECGKVKPPFIPGVVTGEGRSQQRRICSACRSTSRAGMSKSTRRQPTVTATVRLPKLTFCVCRSILQAGMSRSANKQNKSKKGRHRKCLSFLHTLFGFHDLRKSGFGAPGKQ